jgi:hypothetical protein
LERRLDVVAWALFFIMLGVLGFVPHEVAPQGLWLVGAGLILLGVSAVRYATGLRLSVFVVVLGVIALVIGGSEALGFGLPVLPLILLIIGVGLLGGALFERSGT